MPSRLVLLPVKSTRVGKSRLDVPASWRRRLAMAIATDTVTAAAAVTDVVVVVEDPSDAAELAKIKRVSTSVTDVRGLNAAIGDGLAHLVSGPVAVLVGDLPGLDPEDLADALRLADEVERGVVADHLGTGTTLLTANQTTGWAPSFGNNSFDRHRDAGFVPLDVPAGSTLRRDVDVLADLSGPLGPVTTTVLQELSEAGVSVRPAAGCGTR